MKVQNRLTGRKRLIFSPTQPTKMTKVLNAVFNNRTAGALQAMRIMQDVELKLAGNENMVALCIKGAINNGTPYVDIITTMQGMAIDNYNAIADMIGIKLTDDILNYWK